MIKTERFFTDYNFDDSKFPYAEIFAKSIEWLYDINYFNTNDDDDLARRDKMCYMDRSLPLYDLINLVSALVKTALSPFNKIRINEFIQDIGLNRDIFEVSPSLNYRGEYVTIGNMQSSTTSVVVWASYIYCNFRYEHVKTDEYKQAARVLMDKFHDFFWDEEGLKSNILMRNTKKTMRTFNSLYRAEYEKGARRPNGSKAKKKNPAEEESGRSRELAAEVTELKASIQKLEQELKEKDVRIAELEAQLQEMSECPGEEIGWANKVRLELLFHLMKEDGADITIRGNKAKAATVMQKLTGLPLQTCKNYCSNRKLPKDEHSEAIFEINLILEALRMKTRL